MLLTQKHMYVPLTLVGVLTCLNMLVQILLLLILFLVVTAAAVKLPLVLESVCEVAGFLLQHSGSCALLPELSVRCP